LPKRITQLDGIRALAITSVFIHHAFQVKLLWMGVDLFFILSGFLITGILLDKKDEKLSSDFGHFYGRRARRILPPYALLLVITAAFFGLAWIRHWYMYAFLMNFLLAFNIPQPVSLSVLWSLAVEEQFYLLWPFVIFFLSENLIAWFAAAIVIAAPFLRWFCTPLFVNHWPIYSLTPFRMDLLGLGALLAIAWRRHRPLIERFGAFGPILSAIALAVLLVLSRKSGFTTSANNQLANVWIYELSLFMSTGVILWALSGKGVAPLNLSPVRYLGRISYSVYLIHITILLLLRSHFSSKETVAALGFILSLLYASASWFLLEKPLLNAKQRPAPIHYYQHE
jgi:peptidoglycan/LPS O-acetylase OafA/YrhL